MHHDDSQWARPETRLRLAMSHGLTESAVICRGEVDVTTAPLLAGALQLVGATLPSVLFVDMRNVSFLALAGADVLMDAAKDCRAKGISLWIVASPSVRRVLDILGWGEVHETGDLEVPTEVRDALQRVLSTN